MIRECQKDVTWASSMQAIKTNCKFDLQQTIGIVQIIQKLLLFLSFMLLK